MKHSNWGKRAPSVRPIQRIELSETNVKGRIILVAVCLAIAVVAIAVGLSSALRTQPTWQQIKVQSTKMNCGDEFVLDYDFSYAGSEATAQYKALTTLYTEACVNAFNMFSPDVPGEGAANVYDLNTHPNETLTVSQPLYDALSLVQQYQNRNLYLGAVYTEYNQIFQADNEVMAADHDPAQNAEILEYVTEAAAFASDPAMIDIQLLGGNQVKLFVADAYLSFIMENEIEKLIDFSWMRNAFIADYLAKTLADNGFTSGYIASFDGFTRNLDDRGNSYSFNVFDRQGKDVYLPAVITYMAPASVVFLRDYPMGQRDVWHYYAFPDGRIANLLIDPEDGMNKTAVPSLVSYAADESCAQLLLQMIPVFICEELNTEALLDLAANGTHSIWCEGSTLCYTDADAPVSLQPQEGMAYTKVFVN